jgi:hypothetical protein
MFFKFSGPWMLALALVGHLGIVLPSRASVPFTWAHIQALENRADLISAAGMTRSATSQDCLRAGDTLNTDVSSQAELLFNDGSLARIGGNAVLRFWPETRNLELSQGTALLLVPAEQGRTTVQTPNAIVGLQHNAVVVRYVPLNNLTLVMALANPDTGPLAISVHASQQDHALPAGHMALIKDGGIQFVEFDLQEFYNTSDLAMGLHLDDPTYTDPADSPVTTLRPYLLDALVQQLPFPSSSTVLAPEVISNQNPDQSLFAEDEALLLPSDAPHESGELGRYEDAPAGVVSPMPETPTDVPTDGPTEGNPVPAPPAPDPSEAGPTETGQPATPGNAGG